MSKVQVAPQSRSKLGRKSSQKVVASQSLKQIPECLPKPPQMIPRIGAKSSQNIDTVLTAFGINLWSIREFQTSPKTTILSSPSRGYLTLTLQDPTEDPHGISQDRFLLHFGSRNLPLNSNSSVPIAKPRTFLKQLVLFYKT